MAMFSKLLVYQKVKTVFLLRKNDETWWLFTSKLSSSGSRSDRRKVKKTRTAGAMDYLEGTYLVVHLVFSYIYICIYSIIHICDYPEIVKIIQNMWRSKIYPSWCFFCKFPHSIYSRVTIYIYTKCIFFNIVHIMPSGPTSAYFFQDFKHVHHPWVLKGM